MLHHNRFDYLRRGVSLLLALFVVALAGCGGSSSPNPPAGPAPGAPTGKNPGAPRLTSAGPLATPVQRSAGVVRVTVRPQDVLDTPGFAAQAAGKSPSAYSPARAVTRGASDTNTLRTKQASGFDPALPLQGVNGDFASAVFSPDWTHAAPSRLAYATYVISATGYSGLPTVGITWGVGPSDFSTYFVAVANRQLDRWQWFEGPIDDVITLPSLAPYTAPNGDILIMVCLTGKTQCTLSGISLGPEETRGTGNGGLFGGGSGGNGAPPLYGGTLPASVDLSNMCAPIRNQGTLGSCTAFALGDGAMNYEMRRVYGDLGWDFSGDNEKIGPRYLYVETGKDQQLACSPEGRYYDRTVNWLKTNGIPLEASAPYLPTPCSDAWTQAATGDAAVLRPVRAEAVPCTTDAGITQVKTLLAQGRVVPCGTLLDEAFMNWTPQQQPWSFTGPHNGGHAMCIVGYDDSKQAFKVRNSWGPEWGDNGHVWIKYASFKTPGTQATCFVLELERSQAVINRLFGGGGSGFNAPTGVAASDGTFTDKVRITWSAVSGATGYEVYRDLQTNLIQTVAAGSTQFDDTTFNPGNSHTYWVKAVKGSTKSGFSASDVGFAGSGGGGAAPVIYGVQYIPGGIGDQTQFYVDYYSESAATFSWTLGGCNPGSSSAESPQATFSAGGTQTISITVSNGAGSDTMSGEIFVGGASSSPVATLQATPTSGTAPLNVLLDASGSTDDGYISRFDWDWEGDGNFDYTSYLYSVIYVTYPVGEWNTTVRVWDNDGFFTDQSVMITVTGGSQGSFTEIENNDSFQQATAINVGGDSGSIGSGSGYPGYDGDFDDYWGIQVTSPITFQCLMNLNAGTGDLDLYVYDQFGTLGASSATENSQEMIEVFMPPGLYFIRVNGFGGYSDYTLQYAAF